MNNTLEYLLSVIGLLLIISSIVIMFIGFDSEIVGETLCVDGMNRLNLEGIMCEDEINTWFGYNEPFCLLVLIPAFLGMYLFFKGLGHPSGRKADE